MDSVCLQRFSLVTLGTVLASGTPGYARIETWQGVGALQMTVITLATVGCQDVQARSPVGTLVTIMQILHQENLTMGRLDPIAAGERR